MLFGNIKRIFAPLPFALLTLPLAPPCPTSPSLALP